MEAAHTVGQINADPPDPKASGLLGTCGEGSADVVKALSTAFLKPPLSAEF